jgi:urease accessory protein
MLGVGLLAATQPWVVAKKIVLVFLAAMLAGASLGLYGVQFAYVETAILLSLMVIGGLLLVNQLTLSNAVITALVGGSGLMHGLAHGSEIPSTASAYAYLVGMLSATVLLHGLGLSLGKRLNRGYAKLLLRVYGIATGVLGAGLLLTA